MTTLRNSLEPLTQVRSRIGEGLRELVWLHRSAGETLPLALAIMYAVAFLFLCFFPIGAARVGASPAKILQLTLIYVVTPGLGVAAVAYMKGTTDVWAWHGAGVTIWRGQRLRTWWNVKDEYWVFLDDRGRKRVPWVWVGLDGKNVAPETTHPPIALTFFDHASGAGAIDFAQQLNAWEQRRLNTINKLTGITQRQAVSITAGAILAGALWLIALG